MEVIWLLIQTADLDRIASAEVCALVTSLHGMHSVRLYVTRADCDKMVERSVQILYHTKDHLA